MPILFLAIALFPSSFTPLGIVKLSKALLLNPERYSSELGRLTSTRSLSLKAKSSIRFTPSGITNFSSLLYPKAVGILSNDLDNFKCSISFSVNAPASSSVRLSGITNFLSLFPLNADIFIVFIFLGSFISVSA